jgi:hypothetical protein
MTHETHLSRHGMEAVHVAKSTKKRTCRDSMMALACSNRFAVTIGSNAPSRQIHICLGLLTRLCFSLTSVDCRCSPRYISG